MVKKCGLCGRKFGIMDDYYYHPKLKKKLKIRLCEDCCELVDEKKLFDEKLIEEEKIKKEREKASDPAEVFLEKKGIYCLEILFLIEVDDSINENKMMLRTFANRLEKFKKEIKKFLDMTLGKEYIPFGEIVVFYEDSFDTSIIYNDTRIFEKCNRDSVIPILFTNRTRASSSDSFYNKLSENIDAFKWQFESIAKKFGLNGEYIANVFKKNYATSKENESEIIEFKKFEGKFNKISAGNINANFVKSKSDNSTRKKVQMLIFKKDSIKRTFIGVLCFFAFIFCIWLSTSGESGYYYFGFVDLWTMGIILSFIFSVWFLFSGFIKYKQYKDFKNSLKT